MELKASTFAGVRKIEPGKVGGALGRQQRGGWKARSPRELEEQAGEHGAQLQPLLSGEGSQGIAVFTHVPSPGCAHQCQESCKHWYPGLGPRDPQVPGQGKLGSEAVEFQGFLTGTGLRGTALHPTRGWSRDLCI